MTREEAKETLQGSRITSFRPNGTARVKEALNMAIEALSVSSGDLISRADAMAELREWVKRANENGETPTWNDAVSLIGSLPSAELPKGDLISRADAIEAVESLPNTPNGFSDTYSKSCIIEILEDIPSADAVSRYEYDRLYAEADYFAKRLRSADAVDVVRKPIKGYEGYYEVDQFGRVFAKDRTIHVTDHDREYDKHLPSRQMKQSVHTKGYKTVTLTKDGKCTTAFVHRLVAEAFIPNTDDLPFVNHIDEDKTNNFVENLEWCTEQYNSTYGKAREKHAKALKGRHHSEEHKRKISDSLKRFYGERREP